MSPREMEQVPVAENTEAPQTLESIEAAEEVTIEGINERQLEEYREAVQDDIENRAQSVQASGPARVEQIAGAYGLPAETAAQVRQESGVDARIAANAEEIRALTETTKAEVEAIVSEEAAPEVLEDVGGAEILPDSSGEEKEGSQEAPRALEQNFGNLLSEEQVDATLAEHIVPYLNDQLAPIAPELDADEVWHEKYLEDAQALFDPKSPGSYYNYNVLRGEGLSAGQVREMSAAQQEGPEAITAKVKEYIAQERAQVEAMLEQPENQQKLATATRGIEDFFSGMDIPLPRATLPRTQFTAGRWERSVLSSNAAGKLILGENASGWYSGSADGMQVAIPEEDIASGELSNEAVRTYIHENFHGLSARKVVSEEELGLSDKSAQQVKGGFLTRTAGNTRRYNALNGLNEGVTELFARMTAEQIGILDEQRPPESYDSYVADTGALISTLDDGNPKNLAEAYLSPRGTLTLGKQMEKKIGRHSLALFDLLTERKRADYAKFLGAVEKQKAGESPERMLISSKELEPYGLTAEEITGLYPFVDVVGE